jgi:hypothetical protein
MVPLPLLLLLMMMMMMLKHQSGPPALLLLLLLGALLGLLRTWCEWVAGLAVVAPLLLAPVPHCCS